MKMNQSRCQLLGILILAAQIADAQTRAGSYTVLVTPQASFTRIGVDDLASGGASVAERGLSSAMFTNPAGMQFTRLVAYAEAGLYATSKWQIGFDYNGQFVVPALVALGMPVGDVSVALSYVRQYSNRLRTGPMEITTPAFPEGTGEVFGYERWVEMHSLCGSASVALNDQVSVGLTVGGNYFTHSDELAAITTTGKDFGLVVVGGVNVLAEENVSIAGSVGFNSTLSYVPETNLQSTTIGPIDTTLITTTALESPSVEVRFPPVVEIGASWQVVEWLKLLGSLEFQNWTTALDNARNRWQVHAGAVLGNELFATIRLGYFTLSDPRTFGEDAFNQQFLTVGIHFRYEPVMFSVAVMDSHLFTKDRESFSWPYTEPFYQTYVSSGLSVGF